MGGTGEAQPLGWTLGGGNLVIRLLKNSIKILKLVVCNKFFFVL
jgi:hypothetical protein